MSDSVATWNSGIRSVLESVPVVEGYGLDAGPVPDRGPERGPVAVPLLGPDEELAALFEHAADVFHRRGDCTGAVSTFTRAADLSAELTERARRLSKAAFISTALVGDLRAAETLLADLGREPGTAGAGAAGGTPTETAAADSTTLMHSDGDADAAHRMLAEAVAAFDPAGTDPATIESLLETLLLVCHNSGRGQLWELYRLCLQRAGRTHSPGWAARAWLSADPARADARALENLDSDIRALGNNADISDIMRIGSAAVFLDRLPGCRRALHRVAVQAAEYGAATALIYAHIMLAMEAYTSGQWPEARTRAAAAAELAGERGYRLLELTATAVQAALAAGSGDAATARALADQAFSWATPRGAGFLVAAARYAYTKAAIAEGDFETAFQQACRISSAGRLEEYQAYALWVPLDLVEAALHTGREAEAASHVRALRETGVGRISPRLRMLVLAASAMVAPDDEAEALFEQALAEPGTSPWPLETARVHLLYGERLRRTREAARARGHLEQALEVFHRLGAASWAIRASAELRATGAARIRRDFGTNQALTPQELEIALLAATGLSNKQIGSRLLLSHRTVGAHLYRTYPKLGIRTRAALRDALATRLED